MATFTFVLTFTLIALQGSMVFGSASTVTNMNLLAKQVNDKAALLPNVADYLEKKINETVAKHNWNALVVSVNHDIEALLATNEEYQRLCGSKAYNDAEILANNSLAESSQCVEQTKEATAFLWEEFKILEEQILVMTNLLKDTIHDCSNLNHHNLPGFVKCMDENTKDLQPKLKELEKNITQITDLAIETSKIALSELDTCLAKIENRVTLEGRAIIYGLNRCIDNIDMLYSRTLPNNVEKVVAKHDLKALNVELKQTIQKLLSSNKAERLCGSKAHQLVEEINKNSQAGAGMCLVTIGHSPMSSQDALKELDSCFARIENKASLEGRAVVSGLNQCINNIELLYTRTLPNNVEKVVAKYDLNALIVEMKKDIQVLLITNKAERLCGPKAYQLVEEINKNTQAGAELCLATMSQDLMNSKDALKELDSCFAKIENRTSLEGRAVFSGLNQCINNIELLY